MTVRAAARMMKRVFAKLCFPPLAHVVPIMERLAGTHSAEIGESRRFCGRLVRRRRTGKEITLFKSREGRGVLHIFGLTYVETRLTYNCAHLRSTKESLTILKIIENYLGENFFE